MGQQGRTLIGPSGEAHASILILRSREGGCRPCSDAVHKHFFTDDCRREILGRKPEIFELYVIYAINQEPEEIAPGNLLEGSAPE